MAKRGKIDCDEQLLLALAAGASVALAGRQANVSERTVRRRLADPDFRRRISEMRSELVQGAIGRLSMLGRKAADALAILLDDANTQVRLGAARAVLQYMLAGHEHELLAAQVIALQQQIDELTRGAPQKEILP
jgi:hypothetical protein